MDYPLWIAGPDACGADRKFVLRPDAAAARYNQMVRKERLELSPPKGLEPKSSASTSFATFAIPRFPQFCRSRRFATVRLEDSAKRIAAAAKPTRNCLIFQLFTEK
jgi:hypothetical protein